MSALDHKLWRDLRGLTGQYITIALVVACGIAVLVSTGVAWRSLEASRTAYYDRYRMAHVFALLKRAPEEVRARLESIPGVAAVYTRVIAPVRIPIPGELEPARGRIISLPRHGMPPQNGVMLREGRFPEPGRAGEVLMMESYAKAQKLAPGSAFTAIINGRSQRLRVAGIGLSPEFIYPILGGEISFDDRRVAVMWMNRDALAAATQLEGAFNDAVLRLRPDASPRAVIAEVDRVLAPWGGMGAFHLDRQPSNLMVSSEINQLRIMATVMPLMFLGVAAFLVNIVLSRLVRLQRQQIAALKALGYGRAEIAWHYAKLAGVILGTGAFGGVALGAWLGQALTQLYTRYFRFPVLTVQIDPALVVLAVGLSVFAGMAGALAAVASTLRLPAAEAMRPPSPGLFRPSWLDRLGVMRWFMGPERMVIREIMRAPWRPLLSATGIALALAICILAQFGNDAIWYFVEVFYAQAQRQDITVSFMQPVPPSAVATILRFPGVISGETSRAVPIRITHGHVSRDTALVEIPERVSMRKILDDRGAPPLVPGGGAVLTSYLAQLLGTGPGDHVTIEILEGPRARHEVPVGGEFREMFGIPVYMAPGELNRLLGGEPLVSQVHIAVEPQHMAGFVRRINEVPLVADATRQVASLRQYLAEQGNMMIVFSLILTLFASAIAVGVVYNNARATLSARERELASLRVLGFTRGEISRILLGELAVQTAVAIPPGLLTGYWLGKAYAASAGLEAVRFPFFLSSKSYAAATLVTLAAAAISALLVRRRLDHLDMIAVLKERE